MQLKNLLKRETVLLLLIILSFGYRVFSYRQDYITKYDPVFWKNVYEKSQWIIPNSKEGIGDDGLYAYAGWEYIHGRNPILINPEMPPFGKYIFGLSIIIFGNKNIITLILSIGILIILFYLAKEILHHTFLSLLTVLLVTLEPLFYDQIKTTMLEIPYLFFLLLFLLFFSKAQKKTRYFFISGIFLGMFFSTKFFLIGIILSATIIVTQILVNKKRLKYLIVTFSTSALAYSLSYIVFFLNGQGLRQFLGVHKWIFDFYQKSLVNVFPGGPFWMLLFNRWEVWFRGSWFGDHVIISEEKFTFLWPIATILSLAAIFLTIKNLNKSDPIKIIISFWLIFYLGFLFFTPMWARYLLLVIPFMYILALYVLFKTNFLSNVCVAFRKEAVTHRKEYALMVVSVILFITLIKILFTNQGFIFTPIFGHDFQIARDIVFHYKLSSAINLLMLPWYIFLTIPFFLSDGNPSSIIPFMTIITIIIAYAIYRVARRKKGKLAIPFFILSLVSISLTLTLAGRLKLSLPSNSFLSQENEISIIDKTYSWSNGEKFSVAILNDEKNDFHYQYLYGWYGRREYKFLPEFFPYINTKIIYLIAEPNMKAEEISNFLQNNFKETTVEKEEKNPSGIVIKKIRSFK